MSIQPGGLIEVSKPFYKVITPSSLHSSCKLWNTVTKTTRILIIQWENSCCCGREGTRVLLSRVLHTFHELALPRNPYPTACDSPHFIRMKKLRKYVYVYEGGEGAGSRCFRYFRVVKRERLFGIKGTWVTLTLCRPAESPPARPFAQPARTPDPDRFHCGTAEVHSHQATGWQKQNIQS